MNITILIISLSDSLTMDLKSEFEIVGCSKAPVDALMVAEERKPSLILLDYEVETSNTAILIKSLLGESPDSKVILFGNNLSDDVVLSCLTQGIYGYLELKEMRRFLIKAIRAVVQGEAWISRRLVALLIEKIRG